MKKFLCLSMALLMTSACAVGCGKNDDDDSSKVDSKFVGKWEAEKMVCGDEEITDFFGVSVASMFQFDIKDDGTCVIAGDLEDDKEQTVNCTTDGDKITISVEEAEEDKDEEDADSEEENEDSDDEVEELTFTLENDKLVMTEEENGETLSIYLIKVDEFTTIDEEALKNQFSFDEDDIDVDINEDDTDEE